MISCPIIILENYQEAKTFRIQCYNNEGEPLNKFERFMMRDNEDFSRFLKRVGARGIENINDNNEETEVITLRVTLQKIINKYLIVLSQLVFYCIYS